MFFNFSPGMITLLEKGVTVPFAGGSEGKEWLLSIPFCFSLFTE